MSSMNTGDDADEHCKAMQTCGRCRHGRWPVTGPSVGAAPAPLAGQWRHLWLKLLSSDTRSRPAFTVTRQQWCHPFNRWGHRFHNMNPQVLHSQSLSQGLGYTRDILNINKLDQGYPYCFGRMLCSLSPHIWVQVRTCWRNPPMSRVGWSGLSCFPVYC